MRVSARNVLPAKVKTVTPGAVDSEVVMELAPGIEVVSGIALLIPAAAAYGAAALAVTMIGAITTHLFIIGGNPAPAIVLLVFTATIAWFRGIRS